MQTGKALEDTKRIAHHNSYRVHLSSGGGTIYVDNFKSIELQNGAINIKCNPQSKS